MNKEDIIKKIITFLVDEFEVDEEDIQPDAILKDTLGLDSLDYVDLVVSVEANFGVKLVEADFVGIASFQSFYDLIDNKIKLKTA
jgi:acyl carrier protein